VPLFGTRQRPALLGGPAFSRRSHLRQLMGERRYSEGAIREAAAVERLSQNEKESSRLCLNLTVSSNNAPPLLLRSRVL
jgi:hypothetical protein